MHLAEGLYRGGPHAGFGIEQYPHGLRSEVFVEAVQQLKVLEGRARPTAVVAGDAGCLHIDEGAFAPAGDSVTAVPKQKARRFSPARGRDTPLLEQGDLTLHARKWPWVGHCPQDA